MEDHDAHIATNRPGRTLCAPWFRNGLRDEIAGSAGSLVFDLSIEAPPSANHVEIGSFVAPGSVAGLPTTQGGLVAGDLVLPPFNVGSFTEIEVVHSSMN
jgi:hypothetical protein